ncbi:MAG: hypothetical protein K2Q25_12795 [Mycobacteriaceae bacterium]|nr:hypothetical protein [Mycobacteriaceae bacterium]
MTTGFDVAARLQEGRPAVERTQTYVWACHVLGYHHLELTAFDSQIRDYYDSEQGLDLHVLDDDCAQLRSAFHLVDQARRTQLAQIAALAEAGMGPGVDAAIQFLHRHCAAAQAVVSGIRAAAEGCQVLRDQLGELVARKVAVAAAIDDRTIGQRPAWLPAAQAVIAGVSDSLAAEDLIRQQIAPYVDNDIRGEWLATMHRTQAAVAASYDMLIERLTAALPARFAVPEELGLGGQIPGRTAELSIPAAAIPQAARLPSAPDGDTPGPGLAPVLSPSPPLAAPGWGTGLDEGIGFPAAGHSNGVGSLSGLIDRIIQTMGELLGSSTTQPEDRAAEPDPAATVDHATTQSGPQAIAQPAASQLSVAATDRVPVSEPVSEPPVAPAPSAATSSQPLEEKPPCEIAADELPQAGQ